MYPHFVNQTLFKVGIHLNCSQTTYFMCPRFHIGLYATGSLQFLLCSQPSTHQTKMPILTSLSSPGSGSVVFHWSHSSWKSTDKKCLHPRYPLRDKLLVYHTLCPKCLLRQGNRQGLPLQGERSVFLHSSSLWMKFSKATLAAVRDRSLP